MDKEFVSFDIKSNCNFPKLICTFCKRTITNNDRVYYGFDEPFCSFGCRAEVMNQKINNSKRKKQSIFDKVYTTYNNRHHYM